jgi:hypothetical protein
MKRILKNPANLLIMSIMILTMAFIFSCSSDNDPEDKPNNGGGFGDLSTQLSGVSAQLYMDGMEYNGSGDIMFVFKFGESGNYLLDTLPAGKIQNGQIILNNLPENLDKYLREFIREFNLQGISYPNDLYFCGAMPIVIINSEYYRLGLEGENGTAEFAYFSKSGEIKGTLNYDDGDKLTWNANASKGWNLLWFVWQEDSEMIYSTSRPQTIEDLKWKAWQN